MNTQKPFDLADALNRPDEDYENQDISNTLLSETPPLVTEILEIITHLSETGKVPTPIRH